jgi:hypothetical protein
VKKATGRKAGIESADRRLDDLVRLVASSEKMDKELAGTRNIRLKIDLKRMEVASRNVKEIQSLLLNEYQREAEWPICINPSGLKSNLLNQ